MLNLKGSWKGKKYFYSITYNYILYFMYLQTKFCLESCGNVVLYYLKTALIMLLLVSIIGYILVVIKEKFYLMKNIILIEKKSVMQEHLDETDIKEFLLGGIQLKSGDEIKVTLTGDEKITGIVIGAKKKENFILLVTHGDEVRRLVISKIKKIKVISRYGKFFA